jgi:multicomponent Na+:H+ antiporter subunit D
VSPDFAVGLAPFAPLVGAVMIGLAGAQPNLREGVTLVTAGALFLIVAAVAPAVMDGARPAADLYEILPGIALAFEAEPLGMLFALIASFLWIPTSIYSIGYMRAHHETHQTRYYVCFAVALSGAVGVALAANLFTLFLFYELLTISTYPLVTHAGSDEARRAGRLYLGILLGTSIGFQLLAILATYALAGTLDFRPGGILAGKAEPGTIAILFALYMFGIGKAAIMPFHRWLPAAMVAPTPVSALLHAVAVVKAGVFTVLKVVIYVFGLDLMQGAHPGTWLPWLAAFTLLAASFVALTKDNLKARLAYSTISQLAYIVLAASLATSSAIIGGGLHILMHAFGKITLFFCAGAILITAHKENISDMRGLGRAMPLTMFAFLLGSLSVIGLPPFGGAWSKWYLTLGAVEAHQLAFVAALMISSLLNVGYFMPVVVRAFFPGRAATEFDDGVREAPLACLVPLLFTAAACVVLFLFPNAAYRLLLQLVS